MFCVFFIGVTSDSSDLLYFSTYYEVIIMNNIIKEKINEIISNIVDQKLKENNSLSDAIQNNLEKCLMKRINH